MKAAIQDESTLRSLRPLDVAAYLRANGWHQEAEVPGRYGLWLRTVNGESTERDVSVPVKRDFADYALRMQEVLAALASVEERSQIDILRDMLTTTSDLVRIRIRTEDAQQGSLPLEQAVSAIERSRDLMLAAACAVIQKRAFYAKRKPLQAMSYLSHVRMGQTEQGSFVFTILSPVAPKLSHAQSELQLPDTIEPYERRVTRTLMSSLAALNTAVQEAAVRGKMEPFEQAVTSGVSANLCDALVGLASSAGGDGIDISMSWSRTRPIEVTVADQVRFGGDSIAIIEEAARRFRETSPVDDFEIEGFVTRLDRGPQATAGDVTISGPVEGRLKKVVVELGPQAYAVAVQAHTDRQTVRCEGELVRDGRGFRIKNPRNFGLTEQDDGEALAIFD